MYVDDVWSAGSTCSESRLCPGGQTIDYLALETLQSAEQVLRIVGEVIRTEVVQIPYLNRMVNASIALKLESQQVTGSFKIRGAMNRFLQLGADELSAGVVAGSSGNHGIAVSYAASALGSSAVVVLPDDCSHFKRQTLEGAGARVEVFDRRQEDRDQVCWRISRREGRTVIPSSQDLAVIAGAGTVALEFMQQVTGLDALILPIR